MKPYGRTNETVKENPRWKKDYHLHDKNGRKLKNWWEEIIGYVSRGSIKQKIKKQIEQEIEDS